MASVGKDAGTRLAIGLLVVAGCSNHGPSVTLPGFKDVSDAPAVIQTAAKAVVKVGTSGEFATGSFISPHGVLLTNNHVLGVGICPLEGCYVEITFMQQRHSKPQQPQTVFVVPLAVDVGLDMAVVQVSDTPGGAPLDTPSFLTLDSRDAASLVGTHIHVVGHPEGHLKKWSEGEVVDINGAWISTTAFTLPGSSGSPILDDAGHLVGIEHRGPTSQDLGSNVGVDESSIGTASAALIAAMSAPLPPAMWSIAAPATDDDVVAHQVLYLNGHAKDATVSGMPKRVLSSLGSACDAALARNDFASPNDLASALAPCTDAMDWIECRSDAPAGGFGVCPDDVTAWRSRYQGVFDHWHELNGQLELAPIAFGDAALEAYKSNGQAVASQNLRQALGAAMTPLDFDVANYLAAFDVESYDGARLVDFLQGYSNVPGYALSGTSIASAMLWLNNNMAVSGPDVRTFLQRLAGDDNIDLGAKLYIEEVLYESGALD